MNAPAPVPLRIAVRPMRRGDEPFVFRSWLKSCRRCERHRHLPAAVYYRDVHEQLERLMRAAVVGVHLAVAPQDDDELLGFLCTERIGGRPQVLHYAYTRRIDRRRGVFRELAAGAGLDLARPFFYVSHPFMASVMAQAFPAAIYRPDVLALPR